MIDNLIIVCFAGAIIGIIFVVFGYIFELIVNKWFK